jgi:type IV pilus assembly protein PilE
MMVLAVLLGVAFPNYKHYLVRARRMEAESALLNLAADMERYYVNNANSYDGATLEQLGIDENTANGYYRVSIERTDPNSYLVMATPQGAQAKADLGCESLMLDQAGNQQITGSGLAKNCWS